MKHIISILLCCSLMLTCCITGSAATITQNDTHEAAITYALTEEYTVTIPDSVPMGENGEGYFDIIINANRLADGHAVCVSLKSFDHYMESAQGGNKLYYSINVNRWTGDVLWVSKNQGDLITFSPTERHQELQVKLQSLPNQAGTWSDVVTFYIETMPEEKCTHCVLCEVPVWRHHRCDNCGACKDCLGVDICTICNLCNNCCTCDSVFAISDNATLTPFDATYEFTSGMTWEEWIASSYNMPHYWYYDPIMGVCCDYNGFVLSLDVELTEKIEMKRYQATRHE